MAQKFQTAIEALVEEIDTKLREVAELKRTANFLRSRDGEGPLFDDAEEPVGVRRGLAGIRPDQFYGKSPVTAAREYLELRGEAVLPDEIAEALERGGFDYKAQGWSNKANRPRNLAISMSKNSGVFHRLPNGWYGLVKFYPELSRKKVRLVSATNFQDDATEEAEEEILEEPEEPETEETEGEGRTPPSV